MNVIVVPDASMIVIPLIEKNGHTYLSQSNFSKYDNMDICEGNFSLNTFLNTYNSTELPSGVKGRLFLFSKIIDKADAAIVIGRRPKKYKRMYGTLNDLILFGGNACNNAHNLSLKMIWDANIPTLKLQYPITQSEIIDLIDKTNCFLKNFDNSNDFGIGNEKYPVSEVKDILNNLI